MRSERDCMSEGCPGKVKGRPQYCKNCIAKRSKIWHKRKVNVRRIKEMRQTIEKREKIIKDIEQEIKELDEQIKEPVKNDLAINDVVIEQTLDILKQMDEDDFYPYAYFEKGQPRNLPAIICSLRGWEFIGTGRLVQDTHWNRYDAKKVAAQILGISDGDAKELFSEISPELKVRSRSETITRPNTPCLLYTSPSPRDS